MYTTITDQFSIRKNAQEIASNALWVSISTQKITLLSKKITSQLKKNRLLTDEQFGTVKKSPQLIFIQDAVNFCFWAKKNEKKWSVKYPKGTISDGWYGLTACFNRAVEEDIPILDSRFLQKMSINDGKKLFRGVGKTEIPLLKERVRILNETGIILNEKFEGKFENLLKINGNDAIKIVKNIISNFPSFDDSTIINGKKVYFLKRAQICAYDLSLLKDSQIKNVEQLTIFADYKLPQLLRHFGVLEYTKTLADKIDNYELLEKDSIEEIEIRASTIWACELLSQTSNISAPLIDNILWLLSQEITPQMKPYHRVLTTNY